MGCADDRGPDAPTIGPSDDRIAKGLRQGKAEAWSALYEAHFERVWRLVARLVGPDAAAVADVVQETFLAAARSARGFDPVRGTLAWWLDGIARNHAGTHRRNRQRLARVGPHGDLHESLGRHLGQWLEGRCQSPAQTAAAGEVAELVRTTLAELPDDYQTLLTTRYCEGTSAEAIARGQRCTATAIRSKLARARQAFREAFARYCKWPSDGEVIDP